jgi:hypothetical protein
MVRFKNCLEHVYLYFLFNLYVCVEVGGGGEEAVNEGIQDACG